MQTKRRRLLADRVNRRRLAAIRRRLAAPQRTVTAVAVPHTNTRRGVGVVGEQRDAGYGSSRAVLGGVNCKEGHPPTPSEPPFLPLISPRGGDYNRS